MKKILLVFGSLLALVSCSNKEETHPIRKDIEELVFASGQLEWENSYNLTAQTDGVITSVNFDIGSKLIAGDIVARIDNKLNESSSSTAQKQLVIANEDLSNQAPALLQLEQNIEFAEIKLQQDRLQEERFKNLLASNSTSQLEYENKVLSTKSSIANVKALKNQFDLLKKQARQQQINASAQVDNSEIIQNYNQVQVISNGTVIKKFKSVGDFVRRGDIIATIANEKLIEAVINVDETSIAKIKIGQLVYLKLNTHKTKVFQGKISEILSAFDQQSQSFICKVKFTEPLPPTLFGTQLEANIKVGSKKSALLIPRKMVGFGNKVHVKGKKEMIQFTPGIISSEYVEIISGIDETTVLLPIKP